MIGRACHATICSLLVAAVSIQNCYGQGKQGAAATGNGGGQNSGGASLQGISYSLSGAGLKRLQDWPAGWLKDVRLLCYRLESTASGSLPLLLEPMSDNRTAIDVTLSSLHNPNARPGAKAEKKELRDEGRVLAQVDSVIRQIQKGEKNQRIDSVRTLRAKQIARRSSIEALAVAINAVPGLEPRNGTYCSNISDDAPLEMGDLLVVALDISDADLEQVSILNLYLSSQPGAAINPAPMHPSAAQGLTLGFDSGVSAPGKNSPLFLLWPYRLGGDVVPSLTLNAVFTAPPQGFPWKRKTLYATGSVVTTGPADIHYFMTPRGGISSDQSALHWSSAINKSRERDGDVIEWEYAGTSSPTKQDPKTWAGGTHFDVGQIIYAPTTGAYYVVVKSAPDAKTSSVVMPKFALPPFDSVDDGSGSDHLKWLYLGTVPPPSVQNGQVPDQTLSLLNLQLPQVHSLSRYNLAAGVVMSTVTNRTYTVVPQAGNDSAHVATASASPLIDPVLLLSVYLERKGRDEERSINGRDFIPALTFGLSLVSPASNFYGGVSLEPLRNLELVGGINVAKVTTLQSSNPLTASSGGQGGSPGSQTVNTTQRFKGGFFVGATFNFTGFVQALFGGGGGKAASAGPAS